MKRTTIENNPADVKHNAVKVLRAFARLAERNGLAQFQVTTTARTMEVPVGLVRTVRVGDYYDVTIELTGMRGIFSVDIGGKRRAPRRPK